MYSVDPDQIADLVTEAVDAEVRALGPSSASPAAIVSAEQIKAAWYAQAPADDRAPINVTGLVRRLGVTVTDAPEVDESQFWRDLTTGEPCPRSGSMLCTITDPDHLHRAIHMDGPSPALPADPALDVAAAIARVEATPEYQLASANGIQQYTPGEFLPAVVRAALGVADAGAPSAATPARPISLEKVEAFEERIEAAMRGEGLAYADDTACLDTATLQWWLAEHRAHFGLAAPTGGE